MLEFLSKLALSYVRKALMGAGASLVTAGVFDNDEMSQGVGAVMTLISLAWTGYQHWQEHKAQKTADLTGNKAQLVPVVNGGPLPPVS